MLYMNIDISLSHCKNIKAFTDDLDTLEAELNQQKRKYDLSTLADFFKNNQDYIEGNKEIALQLNTIGLKLRQIQPDDPLVKTLQDIVRKILPCHKEEIIST